jgi:hypothetical protein
LQRIIILVAVIIAVPVAMWTITAFVRTYVAPPKVPTFQPLSLAPSPPPDNASAGQQAAVTPAPQDAQPPADQNAMPAAANPPQTADANAPSAAPQLATPSVSAQPMPPPAPDGGAPAATADSTTPTASSQNFAWPSPTTNPPAIPSADGGRNSVATDQPTPGDGAAADLPAPDPLKGRIPMPRRRPNVIAMAEPAVAPDMPAVAPVMPSATASAIPLPRARPASAPEAAPSPPPETPANGYDPTSMH